MAKKIDGYIKLNIPAGAANPSPPVGPALGQRGVNIMEFCKAFNAATDNLEKNMQILENLGKSSKILENLGKSWEILENQ